MRLIGAHVSAAGGVDKALARAAAIGANGAQVFSGSPRVWARSPLSNLDPKKIDSEKQKNGIQSIVTHTIYLTNLASDNPDLVRKSAEVLTYDLEFDSLVKGLGVVVHLGSHQGRGWEAVRDQVAQQLKEIVAKTPKDSHLLIENSAGQSGKLCSDLSEIRWLLDQVDSPRLGWCFDTCHGFCAGYSLGDVTSSEHPDAPRAVAEIERLKLWSSLRCVHVNQSRDPFGSGRDRHANLGEGTIPEADLKSFLNQPHLHKLPLVLEVPGYDDNGPDAENIRRLKELVSE